MIGEPGSNGKSIIDGGDTMNTTLLPRDYSRLGDLALLSENHLEISESLTEAIRMLTLIVERHPQFDGAFRELHTKMSLLQTLQAELGTTVMHFSHRYEETVALLTQNRCLPQNRSNYNNTGEGMSLKIWQEIQ